MTRESHGAPALTPPRKSLKDSCPQLQPPELAETERGPHVLRVEGLWTAVPGPSTDQVGTLGEGSHPSHPAGGGRRLPGREGCWGRGPSDESSARLGQHGHQGGEDQAAGESAPGCWGHSASAQRAADSLRETHSRALLFYLRGKTFFLCSE